MAAALYPLARPLPTAAAPTPCTASRIRATSFVLWLFELFAAIAFLGSASTKLLTTPNMLSGLDAHRSHPCNEAEAAAARRSPAQGQAPTS